MFISSDDDKERVRDNNLQGHSIDPARELTDQVLTNHDSIIIGI